MNLKFWKKEVPDLVPPKKVIPLPLDDARRAQRDLIKLHFKELLVQFKRSATHIKEDIAIVNHESGIDIRQFTLGKKTETHIIIATISIHALPNDQIKTQIQKGKKNVNSEPGEERPTGRDRGSVRRQRI